MPAKKVKKPLFNAPDAWCFWVSDGRVLRNLKDLRDALREMSNESFKYHVAKDRNDFAKWVEDVLQEPIFARKLKTMKTRLTALRSAEAEIKKYQQ